jgi:vacuolar-type H+-ATPase subunit E/Vma4
MAASLGDPEALVAEITRRAHQRAVGLEEEARKRAAAILADANEESESIRRRAQQEADDQLAALRRRSAAREDLEARRRIALLREEPIDRVWRATEERLHPLVRQPDYREVLKRLAFLAAHELGGTECVLAADPTGHALLVPETLEEWSREAGCQFRRAEEPAETWGGLLATSGRARVDATFTTQLALARRVLREEVFSVLSGDRR